MNDSPRKPDRIEKVDAKLAHDDRLNSLLVGVVNEVKAYADQLMGQLQQLSDIGRGLSGEYELDSLLEKILVQACEFASADAGTLYILEDNVLKFEIVQNKSLNIRMGGKTGEPITFDPVELKESNVSAFVALNGIPVNIQDVYDTDLFDFTGPKKFDESTGYRSKSMLVIPMRNHESDVIGVLQLMNAINPKTGEVVPFSPDFENLTESLASQAAIAITNAKLINDMESLFESFVKVMATAIDEKSPITGGHIRRVANLTLTMAHVINEQKEGSFKEVHFSKEKLHELRIAAWMHDIGKVTTPVEIIEKAKKLQTIFDRIEFIDLRLQFLIQNARLEALEKRQVLIEKGAPIEEMEKLEREMQARQEELKDVRKFIHYCNQPSEFLADEAVERLQEIAKKIYTDIDGNACNFLQEDEVKNLSIRKGSITEEERKIMQNHASITLRMLNQIPFTKRLKNIPSFAGAHHECINGKGYPLGLKDDEIPFEGKLMAVTDIAEALTASDRPYKKAMPLDNVYRILTTMANNNELDADMVSLFIKQNVYDRYLEEHEDK